MAFLLPYLFGLGTGILMSVQLGVIFFMLIQVSIRHHPKKGWTIAAGVVTGDLFLVLLAILFTDFITTFLHHHQKETSLVAAAVFLTMGVFALLKKPHDPNAQVNEKWTTHARDFYLKPLLINLANPANAVLWLGIYSVKPAVDYSLAHKLVFAFGAICAIYFTEVGVAYSASALKKYITTKILKIIDVTIGVVLIGLSVKLLVGVL